MMVWRDPRLRLALGLTLVMSVTLFLLLDRVDQDSRLPLVVIFGLATVAIQAGILVRSGFRRSTLFTAQQAFLNGDFEQTIHLLEARVEESRRAQVIPDVKTLTLLGNTYRQSARLDESERVLREALEYYPTDSFPIYGLGRTRLIQGDYAEAARLLEQALNLGMRKAVRADLALALYYSGAERQGLLETVRQAARLLRLENYRALMVNYLLYNLHDDQASADNQEAQIEAQTAKRIMQNTASGLAFWQAEAQRYDRTDYGQRLAADVLVLEALLAEEQREG